MKKILILLTLLLAITSVSATDFMFNHLWDDPSIEIIENHKYNNDIVYYHNSLNESVWMPLKDFEDYFIYQIYGKKKFPSKIDKVEKKGQVIKFKILPKIKEDYFGMIVYDDLSYLKNPKIEMIGNYTNNTFEVNFSTMFEITN